MCHSETFQPIQVKRSDWVGGRGGVLQSGVIVHSHVEVHTHTCGEGSLYVYERGKEWQGKCERKSQWWRTHSRGAGCESRSKGLHAVLAAAAIRWVTPSDTKLAAGPNKTGPVPTAVCVCVCDWETHTLKTHLHKINLPLSSTYTRIHLPHQESAPSSQHSAAKSNKSQLKVNKSTNHLLLIGVCSHTYRA